MYHYLGVAAHPLLYKLNEVYNVISRQFGQATVFNEPVNYTFEIELDAELMDIASSIPQLAAIEKRLKTSSVNFPNFSFGRLNQLLVTIGKYATYIYVQDISS